MAAGGPGFTGARDTAGQAPGRTTGQEGRPGGSTSQRPGRVTPDGRFEQDTLVPRGALPRDVMCPTRARLRVDLDTLLSDLTVSDFALAANPRKSNGTSGRSEGGS